MDHMYHDRHPPSNYADLAWYKRLRKCTITSNTSFSQSLTDGDLGANCNGTFTMVQTFFAAQI
mgnify:CR=1 FL=1